MAMPSAREASMRASFLGVVYQAYYLMPELNAIENVLVAARLAGAGSDSALPSPGRCSTGPGSYSPTSPPATSTKTRRAK